MLHRFNKLDGSEALPILSPRSVSCSPSVHGPIRFPNCSLATIASSLPLSLAFTLACSSPSLSSHENKIKGMAILLRFVSVRNPVSISNQFDLKFFWTRNSKLSLIRFDSYAAPRDANERGPCSYPTQFRIQINISCSW